MIEKCYVTWDDVETFVNVFVDKMKMEGKKFTGVYGLPRGGLVLAVMVSHKLNIPMLLAPADGCLIIDDIADSGKSLYHFTENDTQFNKYYLATMYYHKRSIVTPDYTHFDKEDKWIVFPWESDDE